MTREEVEKLGVGLEVLGIGLEEVGELIEAIRGCHSQREALLLFDAWKERVRKVWRGAVFELHPDRGGDEVEFKKVISVMNMLEDMRISPGMKVYVRFN